MSALATIEDIAGDVATPERIAPVAGRKGRLADLALDALRIDPRFQRVVTAASGTLITRIAAHFDWTKFTPLIVAPDPGEPAAFTVIDGQHRAAAAWLRGDIATLPCWIVEADLPAQSLAFLAINGERTKMHPLAIWHARLAGRDAAAVRLFAVLERAGVALARYPMSQKIRPPHVTMAGADIDSAIDAWGEAAVVTALGWLRAASLAANTSLLQSRMIRAVVPIAVDGAEDRAAVAALSRIDPSQLHAQCIVEAKARGTAALGVMVGRLRAAIARRAA